MEIDLSGRTAFSSTAVEDFGYSPERDGAPRRFVAAHRTTSPVSVPPGTTGAAAAFDDHRRP